MSHRSKISSRSNREYDPLKAGSIDGTDKIPHDNAVRRAMNASYKPAKEDSQRSSEQTLFVSRLPYSVTEEDFCKKFSKAGELKMCKLVTDIVTGINKGYGFIKYLKEKDAVYAYNEYNGIQFQGRPVLVDWKVCHNMPGWIPRRLGGGWGGRKESGQLRFGCRDRAWHRPILIPEDISPKK